MTSILIPLCGLLDPVCLAKEAASSVFTSLVSTLGDGVLTLVKFLSTFWMKVPSPTLATGSGQSWTVAKTITDMNLWLMPVTALIAMCCFAAQLVRISFRTSMREAGKIGRQLVAIMAAPVCIVVVTQILVLAGDAFSPWIVDQATSGGAGSGIEKMLSFGLTNGSAMTAAEAGMYFVVFIFDLLGALVQCVFMAMRGPVLVLLMIFLAPTAAAATSDEGWQRFKRLLMLILGFVLYKPAAAVIYATGLTMMSSKGGNSVANAIWGLVMIVLAALALPALIKFLAPAAAMGSSSMASGAVAAGAIAAGAALLGTGGMGAGAAASAGGGRSASGGAPSPSGGSDPAPSPGAGGGGPTPGGGPAPAPGGGGGGGAPTTGARGGGLNLLSKAADLGHKGSQQLQDDLERGAENTQ